MKPVNKIQKVIIALYLLAAIGAVAAYDPTWSKSQCTTYSYNGLQERYVYGSNRGWVNNNIWDDTTVEGIDCASYVCRCLALPEFVAEGTYAPYPYTTTKLIVGVPNMTEVPSVNELLQWDIWVYTTSTSKHTGFFKQYSGSYIITREARSTTSGVVEGKFSKQSLVDKGTRFWRRSNWAASAQLPTIKTNAASNIAYSSVKLNAAILDNGNATIDNAGFAWGTTSACADGWIAAVPASDDTFSCTLTGLNPSTTYYFQARAQNRIGWGSGAVLNFKTAVEPTSSTFFVDNGQAGTSWTGTWSVSSGTGCYGIDSLWARDGATYTWNFYPWPNGLYEVSMWWTEFTSRGSAVPVKISHSEGSTDLTVNQQVNGSRWNVLGRYSFEAVGSVTLTAKVSYPTSACADAVKFTLVQTNQQPVASIVSIDPKSSFVGDYVTFVGKGADDGVIQACEWVSSINGKFGTSLSVVTSSLSEGVHLISFRVCDDQGVWSVAAEDTIVVSKPSSEFIIDNGDVGTSSTGKWTISGAAGFWGSDSVWARDGATYTWSTASVNAGVYEVFMWWTEFSSRSSSVPVQVYHAEGVTEIPVNQQTSGGQWNSLGVFYFDGSGKVTLLAPGAYPTSYCADAVKFVKTDTAPITAGFTCNVTAGIAPLTVAFTDQSSGIGITNWEWDFDNDGTTDSTLQNPSYTYTKPGIYTVRLVVAGHYGSDELILNDHIFVETPEEIIVDNSTVGTSSTGTWAVSGGENPYGTNSLYARAANCTYTWSFTPQQGGTYEVYLWWTEFSSRGLAIPVTITHNLGTANLAINQQTNGGQWNLAGTYTMQAGKSYRVQIATIGDNSTTSADAVRIRRISSSTAN